MKRYLNTRYNNGVETVDELDSADFETAKDFRNELKRLQFEYSLAGTNCWISKRSTKEWRNGK